MFSFDYSDFPQQQTFQPNFPCSFSHERNPFHHQNLPHQMGIYLPQTLYQDPNTFTIPSNDQYASPIPNSSLVYGFTCNQASIGLSPAKKDRHSKISTAHGVRDRRVRLSMAIAREFFDLQDMLGFDKASHTIGWLLAKSKSAIQEQALGKRGSGLSRSSSLSSSRYEDAFVNSSTDTFTMTGTRKRSVSSTLARPRRSCKSASCSKEEIEKTSHENQANSIVARENRAKARARARERTRDKLCTVAKPIQFDDLGQHTSGKTGCSSHLLADSNSQGFSMSLHDHNLDGLNLIRSRNDCTDYLQNLIFAPTVDEDGSVRVNHLPTLAMGSNNNAEARAMCSSFSGWNIFNFPTDMHMTSRPWDNQDQQQSSQHTLNRLDQEVLENQQEVHI